MHSDVRQPGPGKCSKCGMDLLPEGTRFALVRHMMSSPHAHRHYGRGYARSDGGGDDDDEMKSAQGHPR